MAHHYDEGRLRFDFPDNWPTIKYDGCMFYREFSRVRPEIKAVDFITISPDRTAYFIEVKDYRQHPRTKLTDLGDEIAEKVISTLAALLPAKISARDEGERSAAERILTAQRLRIVLHLEQSKKHTRLFHRSTISADVQQKLRQKLKPIDAHPIVCETGRMHNLPWAVT